VPDANIDPYDLIRRGTREDAALDLAGERDIPAVSGTSDGRSQDAGGAAFQTAGELAGRLVGADPPDPGQHDMMAVRIYADRTGGEPAALPGATPTLELRKADS
jgi:hypothetical protein